MVKKRVAAAIMVILTCLFLFISSKIILVDRFTEIEKVRTYQNVERALNALSFTLHNLDYKALDWAGWDDTYEFVEDANDNYVRTNLEDVTFVKLRLNLMLFINSSGNIVYGKAFDLNAQKELPVSNALKESLLVESPLLRHSNIEGSTKGIVFLPEGPMLVASRPILTSQYKGITRGSLILGRYLDFGEIRHMAQLINLSLSVHHLNDLVISPDLRAELFSLTGETPIAVHPVGDDLIAGYALLKDIYGNPGLVLKVEMPGEIYSQSKASMLYSSLLILGIGLMLWVLILLAIENSERRKAEKKLRESEERFRIAFECAATGMALVGSDGSWLQVNRSLCEALGFSEQELLSMNFQEITHPEDLNVDFFYLRKMLDGELRTSQYEKRYLHKLGHTVWVYLSASKVLNARGKLLYFITQIQDITMRKCAEANLVEARNKAERSERMASLGTMAAGIAHEINQPLNSLKIIVDGILYWNEKGKSFDSGEIIEKMREISAQADRINNIIKRIRSSVRSESQTILTPCSLNEAVEGSLDILGGLLSSLGIQVKKSSPGTILLVRGDKYRLEEVVINLLVNAMQALDATDKEDKEILIATSVEKNIILEISDNATGVCEEFRDKIFEPYFTTKDVGAGMGLGLSIVHSIVTSFNGHVSVMANEKGGATLRVEFPVFEQ